MTETIKVGFKRLNDNAIIPSKAFPTDSGFDLYASKDVIIGPGETTVVPTGIAVQLPEGYEAQVRPRSGVTSKTKLRVQLGTIDNAYRGEIGVIVDNIRTPTLIIEDLGVNSYVIQEDYDVHAETLDGDFEEIDRPKYSIMDGSYVVRKGDKLAQLVIQPLPTVEAYEVEGELEETERGEGGFGSTGVRE